MIDGIHGAGRKFRIKLCFHGPDHALGRGKRLIRFFSVGGECHHGVHGKDIGLLHVGFPTGRECKAEAQAEQAADDTDQEALSVLIKMNWLHFKNILHEHWLKKKIKLYFEEKLCYNLFR